jgi:cytoskeletal protein CcmA (bactofilin family)
LYNGQPNSVNHGLIRKEKAMWTNAAPKQETRPERVQGASRISSDLIIQGNVESTGVIIVDGQVRGDIKGETVSIDENGLVEGLISGKIVAVGGVLKGDVECSLLTVTETGQINGSINYERLDVDAGAKISGVLVCTVKGVKDLIQVSDNAHKD